MYSTLPVYNLALSTLMLAEETTPTCRLYSLQLVQSLLLKPHTPTLIHQVQEAVPVELLQELSSSSNPQVSHTHSIWLKLKGATF